MINTVVEGAYGENLTISGDHDTGFDIEFKSNGLAYVDKGFLKDLAVACEAHINLADLRGRKGRVL
jgi:hypothetical protein